MIDNGGNNIGEKMNILYIVGIGIISVGILRRKLKMNMCKCWPCGSRRCSSNTDISHAGYDPYKGMECITRGCKARFTKWAHFSDEEMATYTRNYEKARDKSGNGSYE